MRSAARLTLAVLICSGTFAGLAASADQTARAWDPATTGGRAELGLLAVPWWPLVLWLALFMAVASLRRIRLGLPLEGPRSWIAFSPGIVPGMAPK